MKEPEESQSGNEPRNASELGGEGNSSEQVDEIGRILSVDARPFIPGIQPEIPLNSTMTVYGKRRSLFISSPFK